MVQTAKLAALDRCLYNLTINLRDGNKARFVWFNRTKIKQLHPISASVV